MQLPQILQFASIVIIVFCIAALCMFRQLWARNSIMFCQQDVWSTVFISSFLIATVGVAASIIWRVQVEMIGGGL